METMKTVTIEANKENIDKAINDIKKYASDNGYQFLGEEKKDGLISSLFGGNKPKFESRSQEKVCSNYLRRLERKMGMANANKFLHFLYKKVYKMDSPRVEFSEQELKIKSARKAWRTSLAETAKLQAIYKESKKGFYKK